MPADSSQARLSADHQQVLQVWLTDFERSWSDGQLAARVRDLPPAGSPLRLATLLGMARLDLQRQWQQGRQVPVEAYLRDYPELGTADTVPVELLRAEYDARKQAGVSADLADFARRFPRRAEELRRQVDPAAPAL